MSIEIIFFGQLIDKTGCSKVVIDNVGTVDALNKAMQVQYPNLVNTKFVIALNNKIAFGNEVINENATLAFMPPYSGG
jgi:molybdopterin synthase sulfur carrier subunit